MPTVLLADADRGWRDGCLWYLSQHGFQVETADDGVDCLAELRRLVPDLLILDLHLLWGGGDGVLAVLRVVPQLLPNRVVLTSAACSAHLFAILASSPAVQVLAKPFRLSALLERATFASDEPNHLSKDRQRPCILVVDDEPAIRDLLRTHLQHEGFRVWSAASGEEALDHCCDHADEIAVILLDVRMPGLDGPQTLDGIRELDVDIPVCFMTGDPGDYERGDLLRRGARHLIDKPFHLNEIVGVVRNLANESMGQLQKN